MAARAGQTEVVRYLIQNGAQVEAKAKVRCAHIAQPGSEMISHLPKGRE